MSDLLALSPGTAVSRWDSFEACLPELLVGASDLNRQVWLTVSVPACIESSFFASEIWSRRVVDTVAGSLVSNICSASIISQEDDISALDSQPMHYQGTLVLA